MGKCEGGNVLRLKIALKQVKTLATECANAFNKTFVKFHGKAELIGTKSGVNTSLLHPQKTYVIKSKRW